MGYQGSHPWHERFENSLTRLRKGQQDAASEECYQIGSGSSGVKLPPDLRLPNFFGVFSPLELDGIADIVSRSNRPPLAEDDRNGTTSAPGADRI